SSSRERMKELITAGVNVVRINFSHAQHEETKKIIADIRELSDTMNTGIAILDDLQVTKLRVGSMAKDSIVKPGDVVSFITGKEFKGNKERVYMNYDAFPSDVKAGERILLDDGKLIFEVIKTNKK